MRISNEEITFIFQGAIDPQTPRALASVRRHFAGSRVVVSTWAGQNAENLDCDQILFNEDPRSFSCTAHTRYGDVYTNINRQLRSTKAGLATVTTKYAFKLRSDLVFGSAAIKKYFSLFDRRDQRYSFFKRRLLVSTLTSKIHSDVDGGLPTPFHVSDWFYFGLTEDLRLLYDSVPEISDEASFSKYHLKYPDRNPCHHLTWRMAPEQYFCVSALGRKFDIRFDDWSDFDAENIRQSEDLLVDNFVFLDFVQHRIWPPKYRRMVLRNNGFTFQFKGYMNFQWFRRRYRARYLTRKSLGIKSLLIRSNMQRFYVWLNAAFG